MATSRALARSHEPAHFTLSGCEPMPLSRDEIGNYEGRYEYWRRPLKPPGCCPIS